MIRRCFQKLWVLDVRYTRCDGILSTRLLDFMTHLRELNVEGAQDWDVGQLQGRLPNIRKLRVTKSTVVCTSCSEDNLFLGMNKMELLEFSGNRTMQGGGVAANLSGISTSSNGLETMIITDGCVGIQKLSFRGCAKLKNLLLSGLFEDLCTLDLSGTAVKTVDLSAMTAQRLDELTLDNCDNLCAILWPPQGKRKIYLHKMHIDTTQSASTCRSREEKMKAGSSSTAATGSSSPRPMVLVNGAQPPSEFNWYISIKDTRLLRSFVPSFKNYFNDHKVHLEVSSPRCYPTVDVSGSENEGTKNETREEQQVVLSNRQQQQPQYNSNASMYYADVATVIVEEHLLQEGDGNGNDAPTITRTRPCPPPDERLGSSDCYMYIQDQQMKTKATMDSGAIATIPSIICDHAYIMHVHDSLYNTSIPGPAPWYNLLWCRVERCPRMEFIFTAPKLGGEGIVLMCYFLRTFWASKLPRTRFMWDMSKLPLSQIYHRSFEEVTLLHLDFCPRLIHVLPFSSSVINRRYLETLEIVWCGDLRVVFPLLDTDTKSHQKQQQQQKKPPGAAITIVDFPNLKHIHLHELPMLESICGRGRIYAPYLETIKIRGCWSLRHLPAVVSNRSNNKVDCDCEKEWWDRLEWDGLDGKHHPSLYRPVHSRYYKRKLLRGSVLI
ncbi:uncharacterized protein LOC8086049 [Sorghum bicolor]|nr:uncharacterized protein LOC8086049 [Sorghum bicolor]|eukprot:XP_002446001.1 uncharacterized protein LOC8086049 [Sorghum bicolor]